jgi:hypothetical protein
MVCSLTLASQKKGNRHQSATLAYARTTFLISAMNENPKSSVVFATAWFCTVASSRIKLKDCAFTTLDIGCGKIRALRRPGIRHEDIYGNAHSQLFEFLTGPARNALQNAETLCNVIRIQVGVSEIYEIRALSHQTQHSADCPTCNTDTARGAARCALRAVQCYMNTIPSDNDMQSLKTTVTTLRSTEDMNAFDNSGTFLGACKRPNGETSHAVGSPSVISGLTRVPLSEIHLPSHNMTCCIYIGTS